MTRVEFRLTMPNVGSWNGKWSGAGRDYLLYESVPNHEAGRFAKGYWYHNFGDGWGAAVESRLMQSGERRKKSAGFCGYNWMVRNIIQYNSTREPKEETSASV